VNAHISCSSKKVMWKRLDCQPRQGRHTLPNGAQATEQNVRAISIGFEAELAAEFS